MAADEDFTEQGNGIKIALSGDVIRKRHIATRASNRREIIVLVEGDSEFSGYSVGLDDVSLQVIELPSEEVSTLSLDYIVSITDGASFEDLSQEEQAVVNRKTGSFRKKCRDWLVNNWPDVYDRSGHEAPPGSSMTVPRAPAPTRPPWLGKMLHETEVSDGNS